MACTMEHRGPDDEGFFLGGTAGLGFRRLSIIDLAGGHQPMSNEDDSLWIVFNGEIYNFQELRSKLDATGRHKFKTRSDTEVIIHLYEEYGERCVDHLRGMFAFAIWDKKRERLFAARDRFGKKPLVYADLPGAFVFGSELKAILKYPGVPRDIDYRAIDLYLTYQYVPSPRTAFQSIRKLPPAHYMVYEKGKIRIERYWQPVFQPKTTLSFAEASERVVEKLKEATRLRMIADVPLGAFLSGGVDSSIIVGLMSELSSRPVKTFSIGFEESSFSELPYARAIAERFHTEHHEFVVKAETVDILPKLAWHYGDPFADPSALPSYYVSEMTRQHVTVALNGDGGDETMGGYLRYQAILFMQYWNRMPAAIRRLIYAAAQALPNGKEAPLGLGWRIKRLLRLGLLDPERAYLSTLCYFHEDQKEPLYTSFMKQAISGSSAPDYLDKILSDVPHLQGVDRYLYTDMLSYLPECLMVKIDVASMANSLEARSPFLDHEFAELAGQLPPEWKLRHLFQKKFLIKKAFRGQLPSSILKRGKQGFGIPLSRWFREELYGYLEGMLLSQKALSRGIFEKPAIRRLLEEHRSQKADHGFRLWALLMLEHWFQVYVDRAGD
jgi:asparagine synthase (glutamine-hydrolysing)